MGAGVLALLFALSRCDDRDANVAAVQEDVTNLPATSPPVASTFSVSEMDHLSTFGTYVAGSGAVPRTFEFERVEFASGSSDIRASDRAEIAMVAVPLKARPNARIRLIGYADARGAADTNADLGKARAESVKAALVSQGVRAANIETASGGETNPADTNATSEGRSENRRTELVLLQR